MADRRSRQQRAEQRTRARTSTRRRALLWRVGFIVLAAVVLVLALRMLGVFEAGAAIDLNAPQLRASRGEAVGTKVESQGNAHVDGQRVTYSTTPPTSGRHWSRWIEWGVYSSQQPDERVVHNLEHGGILIGYGDLSPEQLERLTAVVRTLRRSGYPKIVLEPYPGLRDGKLALTAWQWILALPDYDEAEVVRFVRAHHAGPEAPEPNGP